MLAMTKQFETILEPTGNQTAVDYFNSYGSNSFAWLNWRNTMQRLWLSSLICLLCVSCKSQLPPQWTDSDWDNRKIVNMKLVIRSIAAETVGRETRLSGAIPAQINYSISLDPRVSSGFGETSEGGDNEWGVGVSGSIAFICAKETIDAVNVAAVNEAVLGADRQMRTGTELFAWRNGRWVPASEIVLDDLASADPEGIAKIRQLLRENSRLETTRPLTTKPASRGGQNGLEKEP